MQGATAPHEEDVPPRPQLRIRTPRADLEEFEDFYASYTTFQPCAPTPSPVNDKTMALLLYIVFWGITGLSVGTAILWPQDPSLLPLLITLPSLLYLHGYLFFSP